MRSERIMDAMELLPENMLSAAAAARDKKRMRRWQKAMLRAACICLVLIMSVNVLSLLDFGFGAGAGGYPGDWVNGKYYFQQKYKGVYSYVPGGEPERELHTIWYDSYQVNDYGIYYKRGLSLYVQEHETGKRHKLHSTNIFDCSHIGFELREDGNVVFIGYNKWDKERYELLLDGKTGELIEVGMEKTPYNYHGPTFFNSHYTLGDREFVLVGDDHSWLTLTEKGENILAEGEQVGSYSAAYRGDSLWFSITGYNENKTSMYVILRPDGGLEYLELPNGTYHSFDGEYLYHSEDNSRIFCTRVSDGESWELELSQEVNFHDIAVGDGYIFTTAPWDSHHSCWRIVYENGDPAALEMVDQEIRE